MKVKFLVQTYFKGTRNPGDMLEVERKTAERWSKKRIAEIIEVSEEEVITDMLNENEEEEIKLEDMTAKELYEFCIEQGLEVEPKKNKEYYLEALESNE